MHPIVNHLVQLQELTLIRDEQKVARKGKNLEELNDSIAKMTEQLPHDVRARFTKLHKKDHIFIVPITANGCAACGMKVPVSLVQAVRIGQEMHSCPNCARLLYYPEVAPRRIASTPRKTAPKKVGVSRFSSHTLMVPRLESADMEGVIGELAYKMEKEGFVDKADKLVEAAIRREAIVSTAVDHGLAFPHVRGVEGGGLTAALGISRKGIKFGGSYKTLTRIVFFVVIPMAASAFYLKLLSGLTEAFMKKEARQALMAERDPEKLWKALVKTTRATVK
ncbi:MAG: PTS sugar transporter subunit IIA [Kiritimatiellia bacterium]